MTEIAKKQTLAKFEEEKAKSGKNGRDRSEDRVTEAQEPWNAKPSVTFPPRNKF